MKDLRDPAARTANCLECHIGTKDRNVDHELIAAGHPDLYFELASFSAAMPKHWKEMGEKTALPNEPPVTPDPYFDVRALAVGQAVQLRDQLQRVVRNAQGPIWPEYADLDCFACHHSLVDAASSWQQARGYPGRRPGNPPWNISRFVVLKQVVSEVDPEAARQLDDNVTRLHTLISALNPDKGQAVALANATSDLAAREIPKLDSATYDQARTARIMKAIVNDSDFITTQGERPAEQALMCLKSLYDVYSSRGKPANDAQIQDGLQGLFKLVDNPSAYNSFTFDTQMKALGRLLP
jgi:hypothetical protein